MKLLSIMKLIITIKTINIIFIKMKSYCLKCRKDTEKINRRISNTSNGRTMILSKKSGNRKSRFIENHKSKRTIK